MFLLRINFSDTLEELIMKINLDNVYIKQVIENNDLEDMFSSDLEINKTIDFEAQVVDLDYHENSTR